MLGASAVLVTGAHGRAGRLDHLLIDPDARRRCSGGRRGCVSAYLTNSAIVAGLRDRYQRRGGQDERGGQHERGGYQEPGGGETGGLDYEAAVALARDGDPDAIDAFDEAGRALGILVATLDDTFDPDKVVISGDGIAVTELGSTGCDAAISQHRNPANGPVTMDVEPFEFTEWARAGAILAIRSYLAYGTQRNSPDPDRTRCVDSRTG